MSNRYFIDKFDSSGVRIGVISAFSELTYVRAVNEMGGLVLRMPYHLVNLNDWSVNQILEIWREKNGVLSLQNETAYFVQDWKVYTNNGQHIFEVYAPDANHLLDTRIVAYYAGSEQAEKDGYADDLMKEIVAENLGEDADDVTIWTPETSRIIPTLAVAPNYGASQNVKKGIAYRNVLTACQDIAKSAEEAGTPTYFDIIRTSPGHFEFRTYTGQRGDNHGALSGSVRLVGEIYGNLENAEFSILHSNERTFTLAGGKGEEDDRVLKHAIDINRALQGHPYNLRELFFDARNSEVEGQIQSEADTALNESKPKSYITGNLVDTYGFAWNVHYKFGDVLSVEAFGRKVDCKVNKVSVRVSADGYERIEAALEGEL